MISRNSAVQFASGMLNDAPKATCRRTQQLAALLAQHRGELLGPFARSLKFDRFQTLRNNTQRGLQMDGNGVAITRAKDFCARE